MDAEAEAKEAADVSGRRDCTRRLEPDIVWRQINILPDKIFLNIRLLEYMILLLLLSMTLEIRYCMVIKIQHLLCVLVICKIKFLQYIRVQRNINSLLTNIC